MFGSSGARGAAYEESSESSNLDLLSKKLAADLRQHVRDLKPHALFTKEWIAMIESLQYVAGIAAMEERLPKRAGSDSDQTLWDGEELAIRYLLEEGKLNLILRILHTFKVQMNSSDADAIISKVAAENSTEKATMLQYGSLFEQHAGTILRCALSHKEALQTVDMPEMSEHIGQVFSHLLGDAEVGSIKDYTGMQEVMVIYYLAAIGQGLEDIPEDRTMLLFCDHNVTSQFVRVLACPVAIYDRDCLLAATRALNALVESEHFQTHRDAHFTSPEDVSALVALEEKFLAELCKDVKFRISVRPLCDLIKREKMKFK